MTYSDMQEETTPAAESLSDRELEILKLVATGASNKEIAQQLYISLNTVKVHMRNIFGKIDAKSRTEATLYAIRHKIASAGRAEADVQPEVMDDVPLEPPLEEIPIIEELNNEPPGRTFSRRMIYAFAALIAIIFIGVTMTTWWWIRGSAAFASQVEATSTSETTTQPSPTAAPVVEALAWDNRAPLMVPRKGHASVANQQHLLIIGGTTSNGVSGDLQEFTLDTNSWRSLADKPTPVTNIGAVLLSGRVYVPGGILQDGSVTNVLEVYDIQENTWYTATAMPVNLSRYAITSLEGRIYLFGGWDGESIQNITLEYDFLNDEWSYRTQMQTARQDASAAAYQDGILIAGGITDQGTYLSSVVVYQPSRDRNGTSPWTRRTPLPEARSELQLLTVADVVYAVGGGSQNNSDNTSLTSLGFFRAQETWNILALPDLPQRRGFGIDLIDGNVIISGGELESGELSAELLSYKVLYSIVIPAIVP